MTKQNYKELTAAVKESGIPLQMQKELQVLIDKEFKQEERCKKLSPIFNDDSVETEQKAGEEMRENAIPPNRRLSRITSEGKLSVEVSSDWKEQIFDYEECGSVEHFERLNKRDMVIAPGKDKQGLFCKECDSEIGEDDRFCWWCGQRLKEGE